MGKCCLWFPQFLKLWFWEKYEFFNKNSWATKKTDIKFIILQPLKNVFLYADIIIKWFLRIFQNLGFHGISIGISRILRQLLLWIEDAKFNWLVILNSHSAKYGLSKRLILAMCLHITDKCFLTVISSLKGVGFTLTLKKSRELQIYNEH